MSLINFGAILSSKASQSFPHEGSFYPYNVQFAEQVRWIGKREAGQPVTSWFYLFCHIVKMCNKFGKGSAQSFKNK